jgi:hypothetical protein
MYARQSQDGQSPRAQGYPLTEQSNRVPLQEQPSPPAYRPPNAQQWGQNGWPNTREVIRKGEGGNSPSGGNGNYNNGKWGRGRKKEGPISDPTPPSLAPPVLTKAEKAERQLLRALFSPEWRVRVLQGLRPELLVTREGGRVYRWAACTPALPDGGLDPRRLLLLAEEEETLPVGAVEATPQRDENAAQDTTTTDHASRNQNTAKFSAFVRELLEESPYFVSNEGFSEAILKGCIGVLQQFRAEREMQELARQLENAPTPHERRAIYEQYHQKMRAMRGTPVTVTEDGEDGTSKNDPRP